MKTKLIFVATLFALPTWANFTIYSDRAPGRLATAVTAFEAKTGQKVTFVEGSYKDLLKKLEAEGAATPADLIITKDLVYLNELTDKKMLQPMVKTAAINTVASSMQDPALNWVAITYRVRSMAYRAGLQASQLPKSYKDLADPKWRGKLCLRSSSHDYNLALAAHLIDVHGATVAKTIFTGWVANLSHMKGKPDQPAIYAGDTAVLEAIGNGNCEFGIANHYYLAQLVFKDKSFPVQMAFLDQDEKGVHTNGTGVGIVAASKQQALAQQFIDILLTDAVQLKVAADIFDYPAATHLTPDTLIKDWGKFKSANSNWSDLGKLFDDARKVMDEAGYR